MSKGLYGYREESGRIPFVAGCVVGGLVVILAFLIISAFGSCAHAADVKLALDQTFGNEGGYTVDQGGPTKYGISQHSYPKENIKALTIDRAAQIYRRDFWAQMRGDQIVSDIIAGEGFDWGVNGGIGTSIKAMQEACNLAYYPSPPVKVNGVMDKTTLARLNGKNQDLVYVNMVGLRYGRYHFLAANNPDKYMASFRSWTKRVKRNVRAGVHAYDKYLAGQK